jgi:hypothetical protein
MHLNKLKNVCQLYPLFGDSYTIGEGVPVHESFPYQAVEILRRQGFQFHAPEIIAQTGWTTFELKDHTSHTILNEAYDFVTLLIGVNNQYRGLPSEEYKTDFDFLLIKAIKYAGNKADHVIVLSIPDWGITPFAEGRDTKKISKEIDEFNVINKELANAAGTHYIDITPFTQKITSESLVADKLHYAGKEYAIWAKEVAGVMEQNLIKSSMQRGKTRKSL